MSTRRNVSRTRRTVVAVVAASVTLAAALFGLWWGPLSTKVTDAQPAETASGSPQSDPTVMTEGAAPDDPVEPRDKAAGSEDAATSPKQGSQAPRPGEEPPPDPPTDEVMATSLEGVFRDELDVLGNVDSTRRPTVEPALVSGPYGEALANKLLEYEASGLRQIGYPEITAIDVLEEHLDEAPPRVVVYACIDSSAVDVVDESDNSLLNEGSPPTSAQIYTLVWQGENWLVYDATFPDDPRC